MISRRILSLATASIIAAWMILGITAGGNGEDTVIVPIGTPIYDYCRSHGIELSKRESLGNIVTERNLFGTGVGAANTEITGSIDQFVEDMKNDSSVRIVFYTEENLTTCEKEGCRDVLERKYWVFISQGSAYWISVNTQYAVAPNSKFILQQANESTVTFARIPEKPGLKMDGKLLIMIFLLLVVCFGVYRSVTGQTSYEPPKRRR